MKLFLAIPLLLIGLLAPLRAESYTQEAGPIACPAPTAAAPIWGKLVMTGNTVTCYYARGPATPSTWTRIGQPQTIGFINDPVLVGICCTSHNVANLSTGTVDNFSISPAPKYRLADGDIGAPALMGSANLVNGVWTITGSGTNIWDASDQCNFQPWLVWGDCTVICRIISLSTTGETGQKIGIMIRDGYNSGSDYALFCAFNGLGVAYQWRPEFNNNHDQTLLVAPPAPGTTSGISIGYGQTGTTSYTIRP